MEKTSLPLAYYLNNGEPDKTGYQQIALNAFYKAVNFHPSKSCVTLGPNAQVNEKKPKSFDTVLDNQLDKKYKSCETESHNDSISIAIESLEKSVSNRSLVSSSEKQQTSSSLDNDSETYNRELSIFESPEEKEEKLFRKRILSSLENLCLLESQEKINNMKRDWMKRNEDTMTRLQEELNATKSVLVEKMNDDFHERQMVVENLKKESHEIKNGEKPRKILTPFTGKKEENVISITLGIGEKKDKDSVISKEPTNIIDSKTNTLELDGSQLLKPKVTQMLKPPQKSPLNKDATTITFELKPPTTNLEEQRIENAPVCPKEDKKNLSTEKIPSAEKNPRAEKNPSVEKNPIEAQIPSKSQTSSSEQISAGIEKPPEKDEKKIKSVEAASLMEEDIISEVKKQIQKTKEIDPEVERIQNVMKHYKKYKKVHTEASIALNQFLGDDSLKKFRSDCQKAVNVPVNAISGVSAAHLTDKLNKLTALLSGNSVLVNNKSFTASQHPLGKTYCTYLLAEKIVKQGEDAVSVKSDSAFPIALVVLELWRQFPDFGDLLVGAFQNKCPYLIPIYWIKEDGMSNEEYDRLLGFKYADGERENIDMFLKRQGGIVRLYFSIIISHLRIASKQSPHPLPLVEAWRWLAMFTGLEPSAEITATLLYDMLEVTGHSLLKAYGKQFLKLIHLVCVHFIPKIEKVTPKGKGGPVSRLKSFLEQLIRTHDVKPPKGVMPLNFW